MNTLRSRLIVLGLSLAGVGIAPRPADACMFGLFGCRHKAKKAECNATTANYVAPCNSCAPVVAVAAAPACNACAPPPQPIAVTQTVMQQRCYMAPVTTMETRTAVEPVTSYQTSTYLEPVTTMRTSAYYDPCNCGYTTVQTPVTSYVQRQQVTPVTSYVQRHYQVPVTRYEQRAVMEPVTQTQYYYPAQAVAIPAAAPMVAAAPVAAAPLALPAPQQHSQYLTPVPANQPQVGQYQQPQTSQYQQPQAGNPQQQGQGQGNVVERNYQQPNSAGEKTTLIERVYRNGQMVEEKTQYIAPGQQLPAPRTGDATPPATKSSYVPPAPPNLLKPIPLERTAWLQPRNADVQWTALQR